MIIVFKLRWQICLSLFLLTRNYMIFLKFNQFKGRKLLFKEDILQKLIMVSNLWTEKKIRILINDPYFAKLYKIFGFPFLFCVLMIKVSYIFCKYVLEFPKNLNFLEPAKKYLSHKLLFQKMFAIYLYICVNLFIKYFEQISQFEFATDFSVLHFILKCTKKATNSAKFLRH